jgi:hypothetical protein
LGELHVAKNYRPTSKRYRAKDLPVDPLVHQWVGGAVPKQK